MTDDDRIRTLVRSVVSPAEGGEPARDLWPLVVARLHAPVGRSWQDLALAAATIAVLLRLPHLALLIAYHL